MSDKQMCYVQTISSLAPIPKKDKIVLASFEESSWKTIVSNEDFKVGDKALFFEVNSAIAPDWLNEDYVDEKTKKRTPRKESITEFEFLKNRSWKEKYQRYVIKTMKMGEEYSQGLAMPMKAMAKYYRDNKLLIDVKNIDDIIAVESNPRRIDSCKEYASFNRLQRFLMRIPLFRRIVWKLHARKAIKSTYPSQIVSKTDETQVQNLKYIFESWKDKKFYSTIKVDGSSATYFVHKGEFYICSRNLIVYKKPLAVAVKELSWDNRAKVANDHYWYLAAKYEIPRWYNISDTNRDFCIQGEACGPGIQKNRLGLKDKELFIFNLYDKRTGRYYSYNQANTIILNIQSSYVTNAETMKMVPLKEYGIFEFKSLDELRKYAEGSYDNGFPQEGVVLRLVDEDDVYCKQPERGMHAMASFKMINEQFRLKTE